MEDTKKITISATATREVTPAKGMPPNCLKSASSTSLLATAWLTAVSPAAAKSRRALPPRAPNQTMVTRVGPSSAARMNSRTVRPLETRAMNIPTKGDHATHQAQ